MYKGLQLNFDLVFGDNSYFSVYCTSEVKR